MRPRNGSTPSPRRARAAGFSLLEVQVAFVLLGIAMTGVGPLVIMQLRLSRKVEMGFNPQTAYFRPGTTFYLVPRSDSWERKLGMAADLLASAPALPGSGTPPSTTHKVTVTAPLEKSLASEDITVHVLVTEIPPAGGGGESGGGTP